MAIKIIKPDQKEFRGFCDRCGCEFTYELVDLKLSSTGNKVSCPTCNKDYIHPAIVQNTVIPSGIGYQWPSDSTDPCSGCAWREILFRDGLYVGDTPCTWCNKDKFSYTISVGAILSELEADREYVNQKLQEVYNATGVKTDDLAHGTVMSTILNACQDRTSNLNKCDDTEGCNSCSSEHKCGGKKNRKGKH